MFMSKINQIKNLSKAPVISSFLFKIYFYLYMHSLQRFHPKHEVDDMRWFPEHTNIILEIKIPNWETFLSQNFLCLMQLFILYNNVFKPCLFLSVATISRNSFLKILFWSNDLPLNDLSKAFLPHLFFWPPGVLACLANFQFNLIC